MALLILKSLTADLLPAALELDRRCFNGLWTADGYQREIDSPNSELFVLQKQWNASHEKSADLENENSANSLVASLPRDPQEVADPLLSSVLALGCYWAILEEAHITILAVDPNCQGQGLGQALLHALLISACQRGLERATLEVRISNQAAISLYEKFGFREAGRRRRYYQDTGEDALVLWKGGLQSAEFLAFLQDLHAQICDRLYKSGYQFISGQTDQNWGSMNLTCQ